MSTNIYGKKKIPAEEKLEIINLLITGNEEEAKNLLDKLIAESTIHVGKFSRGWKFLFYTNNLVVKSIKEYKEWLEEYNLETEYGVDLSQTEFWDNVKSAQNERKPRDSYILDGCCFLDREFC